MHFGFSYVGFTFLVMLMVPNLIWTKNQPKDYEKYAAGENVILGIAVVILGIGHIGIHLMHRKEIESI